MRVIVTFKTGPSVAHNNLGMSVWLEYMKTYKEICGLMVAGKRRMVTLDKISETKVFMQPMKSFLSCLFIVALMIRIGNCSVSV